MASVVQRVSQGHEAPLTRLQLRDELHAFAQGPWLKVFITKSQLHEELHNFAQGQLTKVLNNQQDALVQRFYDIVDGNLPKESTCTSRSDVRTLDRGKTGSSEFLQLAKSKTDSSDFLLKSKTGSSDVLFCPPHMVEGKKNKRASVQKRASVKITFGRDIVADDDEKVGISRSKRASVQELEDDFPTEKTRRRTNRLQSGRADLLKLNTPILVRGDTYNSHLDRQPSSSSLHPSISARQATAGLEGRLDSRDIVLADEPFAHGHKASLCQKLRFAVESTRFEQMSGCFVLLNALSLGYDTDALARNQTSAITHYTEVTFCVIFLTELIVRMAALGPDFFYNGGCCKWNLFDTVLVTMQVVEQVMIFLHTSSQHLNTATLRLLRLLRVARIARLLRTFHLFDDLRVIVTSIGNSIASLGWSMILLLMIVYIASLVFLQLIVGAGETEHSDQINYWFANLFRTFLTMFECVVGGVSWDEVVSPIVQDISPAMAILFCMYISMCLFAMMNLLTGVFVDKAMVSVREDKDLVMALRIRDLFLAKHWTEDGHVEVVDTITWEDFQEKLEADAMKEYFKQINVEISEARSLFELMDSDGSGSLDSFEIVRACLAFRGPARALELAVLMKDVQCISDQLTEIDDNINTIRNSLPVRNEKDRWTS